MPVFVPAAGQNLAVNGVDLSQYATVVFSNAPFMGAPKKRAKNVLVPGRHGTVRTPRKRFDEPDVVVKLWVLGAQPDGTVPVGSTAAQQLYARADALMALLSASDTVTLTRTMPDGSTRQCVAEVLEKIDWTRQLGERPLLAQISVALTIPGVFWFDTTPVTATVSGPTGTMSTLTPFMGATAPIENLTITFGPCSNPLIGQGNTYLQYNGVISSGRQLVVSTATWTLSAGTGSPWAPSYGALSYAPGPPWFALDPTQPLAVTLTHTGGGSAQVQFTGPRAYLTA